MKIDIRNIPEHSEARAIAEHERTHLKDDLRLELISATCRQYRDAGCDVRIVTPDRGMFAGIDHLFVDGRCVGFFSPHSDDGAVYHAYPPESTEYKAPVRERAKDFWHSR
jgi:hypothetical protein